MITAPFNFVPLNEKVFFPLWSEKVSHDIPFEDGESGIIDVTIKAKSPIFIRDHANPEKFCNHNGEYYIPSTSLKGMVRNVLEIMSFSKIKTDTKKYTKTTSIRDMTNTKELVGVANGCGFLKQDADNNWIIVDYGKPRTIEYSNQQKKIINIPDNEIIDCNFDTAQDKYSECSLYKIINIQKDIKDLTNRDGKIIGEKPIATISAKGEEAYIVLTGGIDSKKNEFIFASSDKKENIKNIHKVVEKFKKVYFESESVDGNFWRDNWNREIGIPIFYKKNGNTVTDIGLSQLFKLAYNHTIDEATKQVFETITRDKKQYIKLDLAETIFGTTQNELLKDEKSKKDTFALKGRVQFSHFKIDNIPNNYDEVYTVLGSPNSSYYPEYIAQNCKKDGKVLNDKYNTLMDKTSKIAGWKRYPLRYGKPKFIKAEEGTDSATKFVPLGTYNGDNFNEFTFSGKVRFHNLKKEEIGALISALTFHDNQENFYHNIGMAKSLGFGKIKIDIKTNKYKEHLIKYETMMNNFTKDWIASEQIKELFTMAFKDLNINDKLKYLKLDPDKNNEFVDKKNIKLNRNIKGRECLPKASELFDMEDNLPKTLLTKEVLEQIKINNEILKQKKDFENELSIINNSDNIQIVQNFIEKYPKYEKIGDIKEKLKALTDGQSQNKFDKVNKQFDSAYDALQKKKGNQKQYQKELEKFIKKWKEPKNNKGSEFVLNLLEKVKGN